MPQITNDYNRVQLLKLSSETGASGPLIVMQHGHSPHDTSFQDGVFLLRTDGKWVDFVALGAASDPKLWDACLFEKSSDVLKLLNTGNLDAEIHALEITPEALASWLSRTAGYTAQQRIDNLVNLYKERVRNRKR
jgi:hypothetical protein